MAKNTPRNSWAAMAGNKQDPASRPAAGHPQAPSSKPSNPSKSQPTASEPSPLYQRIKSTTRITRAHVFFHSGPLSNWYLSSTFSGKHALEVLLPLLATANVTHPSVTAVSTQLLSHHDFNCGEQWMMACKAWLFEIDVGAEDASAIPGGFETLQKDMYSSTAPIGLGPRGRKLHGSSLCRILRAKTPKEQKALGKTVEGFNDAVWEKACMPIVIAGSVARAEVTPVLKEIYVDNVGGRRGFCEGSPMDRIWGVGIRWDNPVIDNPKHWRGKNLLGRCHDKACRIVCEGEKGKAVMMEEGV